MSDTPTTVQEAVFTSPAPLYKFSSFVGAKAMLENSYIWTKSPLDFNDPFEVLPAFDEERKNEAILSRKQFYQKMGLPSGGDLIAGGGEERMSVESFVDLAAYYHDPFFAKIYQRYRVLCFSEAVDPILLWSHYASSHSGIAVGFDLNRGTFPLGRVTTGIKVNYIADRSDLKLPIDYYRFKALEMMDPSPAPAGYTTTSSGIIISKQDEQARYLDCLQTLLANKYDVWQYEEERRYLYDLGLSWEDGLKDSTPDHNGATHKAAYFSPESVTEIVFGYKCKAADIKALIPLIERLPSVRLFYVDLHPTQFKVRLHEGDILQVMATHSMREQQSFRYRVG